MSVPISACQIAQAAQLTPGARAKLAERVVYGPRFGGFQIFPCLHDAKCSAATPDQLAALQLDLPALTPVIEHLKTSSK